MKKTLISIVTITIGLLIVDSLNYPAAAEDAGSNFLNIARQTGVEIKEEAGVYIWQGSTVGKIKPAGPLSGKKIGIIAASEFSDFQAYYLASYISEFGGEPVFIIVDWITWKFTRPHIKSKGVRGMFGMSVDPIGVMGDGARHRHKTMNEAKPEDYDALVIMGGHSADVMVADQKVIDFITAAHKNNAVIGSIGGGSLPLIRAKILNGKTVTGNKVVSFMLKKITIFKSIPVVRDERIITARDTVDTPTFVRELCSAFDPDFVPERKDILKGKRILIIAGEDFEDIELAVPVMEYIYRGAKVTLATFPAPVRSRPPLIGMDVVVGNYGLSVPFQEIPEEYYKIVKLSKVRVKNYDVFQIPGAFCPWNMVVADEPVQLLKKVYKANKIVAAICHGPIPLAAADLVEGKKTTGWLACQDALEIMGATYNWQWSAVADGRIVTGRVPDDIPEFIDAVTFALLSQ
jgi:protease I